MSIDLSVIVPTFARPAKIGACVAALARQSYPQDRFEVLVGLDGPDPASIEAVTRVWDGPEEQLVIDVARHSGPSAVRNRALARCRGRTVLFLNDDVVPSRTLVEIHAHEQEEAQRRGRPALVVGSAPWKRHKPDRLFDRLLRETSMIFFYDRMDTPEGRAQPMRDWGFRHAWSLNLSAPLDLVREVGAFTVFPQPFYGYEDVDLAFRAHRHRKAPVLYRPAAAAEHDHRMDPVEYLRREYTLGHEALTVARLCPDYARALFGRDLTSREESDYSRRFVERERDACAKIRPSFEHLGELPSDTFDAELWPAMRRLLYEHHLPLKRWAWRVGFVDALDGKAMEPRAIEASNSARLAA